jgi:iron only hydrogenase large subunit-like protein
VEQVYGAIKAVGFSEIIEVAQGAMVTTEKETEEFRERMENGEPFMTTSCCPSYIEMAEKHAPELKKYISTTKSPMYYTAEIAREKYPDAKLVFIGPCIAKRKEALKHGNVDYVMTFEELNATFEGMGIGMSEDQTYKVDYVSSRDAHGFAQTGGVTAAVAAQAGEGFEFTSLRMAPLNKKNIAMMKVYAKMPAKAPAQFIEVMACEGGCISGPSSHTGYDVGKPIFNKELLNR